MIETKRSLFDNLQNFFGFDNFKGEQEAIITNILAGNDTFVIMPTGGGKSMCYQLPALMSDGTAIVISPLIALMKNQVDQLRAFGGSDSIAHFLNSSLTKADIARATVIQKYSYGIAVIVCDCQVQLAIPIDVAEGNCMRVVSYGDNACNDKAYITG